MLEQIKFPKYFDRVAILNAFKTLGTVELYDFFDCNNPTAFSNLLRRYFPDKPARMSYSEYVRGLLAEEVKLVNKVTFEPKIDQYEATPPEVQPRVRIEADIERSKTLWNQSGTMTQRAWLKNGHPDPMKETVDAPYIEKDVYND